MRYRKHIRGSSVLGVLLLALLIVLALTARVASAQTRTITFEGASSRQRIAISDINPAWPADWSDFNFLVLEMRPSTPHRFRITVVTADGPRSIMIQPFGQGAWLRASVPLRYFKGRDQFGFDLASTNNRRANSFWMSIWGPFGELTNVQAIEFSMDSPLDASVLEIRSFQLSKTDPGSDFLEQRPVLDEFNQWAFSDWPGKIKSREQLAKELAAEDFSLKPADFGYAPTGGYADTQTKATGFFRVEQIGGRWWFVDPQGHLFLSTSSNGLPGAGRRGSGRAQGAGDSDALKLVNRRLNAWGLNTGGQGRPYASYLSVPRGPHTFLGLPDVYSDDYAQAAEQAALAQCAPRKDDPLLLGYFIGNEPPWMGRESELVGMILKAEPTATQSRLKEFLAAGDSPPRRRGFVVAAFAKQLDVVGSALKKYDPNHLNLGIRFGGSPPDDVLRCARVFDVCSINVYNYEPTRQIARTNQVTGRPVLIGEFHLGVPANGLGAGLVQARDQIERAKGYRYYVEQAASQPGFVGAHWFTWRDEPVLGRNDGENYNIGFVDVTNRPYIELVKSAIATHQRLEKVHLGKLQPFDEHPKASNAGTATPRRVG